MADQGMGKPRRLWRIVLVASLALNLAVVGIVAGAAFSGRLGKGPPRAFDLGLGPVARALDTADRRAIGAVLRRDGDLRRLDLRAEVGLIVATLRQDPFDPEAMRTLMTRQSNRLVDIQAKAQDALINQISGMSARDRADFADRLEQELSRPRPSRGGRSGG